MTADGGHNRFYAMREAVYDVGTGELRVKKIWVGVAAVAVVLGACAPVVVAQEAAAPLTKMPYSPSLDLTDMDKTVDPCVDFYKYSCGGWQKNNPIPADQPSWSVYAKLGTANQQFLWGILEEDAKMAKRTPVQQKVGDYFAACMNTAAIDAQGLAPLQPELTKLEGLKTREALIADLTRLHHELGGFFFGSGTGQDAVDSSLMIVQVGAGGLGLPDRDYYTKDDAKSVKIREQYVAFVTQMLTMSGESAEKAKADAATVLRIETALAKASLTRVQRRDPHQTYHMMTVAEIQKLAPAINWSNVL